MRARVLLGLLAAVAGCGDALVTRDYRGVPMLSVEGRVVDFSYARNEEELRASVFWSLEDRPSVDVADLVEHPDVATKVTFPATFEINVFSPPPSSRLDGSRPFQIGTILVYADTDGDGRLSDGELRGGSTSLAIVFAPERIPADRSPSREPIEAGFSIVRLPLPCNFAPPPVQGAPADCGVPVGAACAADDDCGTGFCLLEDGITEFANGYCTMRWTPGGCEPSDAVLPYYASDDPQAREELLFLQPCLTNGECREGYGCFLDLGGCMPEEPLFIDVYPDFAPMPFCLEDLIAW